MSGKFIRQRRRHQPRNTLTTRNGRWK
jgi:hypothetical protein